MRADVATLPRGDETEIGEKGITLSGGQKQRTAIARAVYADADLVAMDDPLSALDAHVAKDLFRKCVVGACREKAVLLVTHQLQFVNQADHVVVMADGAIAERGTYDELVAKEGGSFRQLMDAYHGEDEGLAEEEEDGAAPREGPEGGSVPSSAAATTAGTTPSAGGYPGGGGGGGGAHRGAHGVRRRGGGGRARGGRRGSAARGRARSLTVRGAPPTSPRKTRRSAPGRRGRKTVRAPPNPRARSRRRPGAREPSPRRRT